MALIAAAQVVFAQDARSVQLDRRLRSPATFQTDKCVAKVVVETREVSNLPTPNGDITVVIDERYRMSVRALPKWTRGSYSIAFAPHDFLCDGKTHRVELTWKGTRSTIYEVTFPGATASRTSPSIRLR